MGTVPAPSAAFPSIQVQGDVQGSIVFGDNNFVVNSNHGTIVYKAPQPGIRRLAARPPAPRHPLNFLDRSTEVQQASNVLTGYQPVALHGAEGIGKTALLKRIANLFSPEQFPDGVVFLDGDWEALSASGLDGVVQSVFDALFESDPHLKISLSTARTYLGSVKPLIVLDHLGLPRQAWRTLPDLFPAGGLIWSMHNSPPGQAAWELPLSGLPPEESHNLLVQTSGVSPTEADPAVLQQICEKLNHHPLSIVTLGRWIRTGTVSLPEALERISAQTGPENNADEPALAAIVATLHEPEAEILSLLAAAAGPQVDRSVLIQSSSSEPPAAETALNALQEIGLFQADGAEVGLHPVHKTITRKLLPVGDAQRARLAQAILSFCIAHQGLPASVRGQLGNLLGVLDYSLQTGRTEWAALAARLAAPQLVLSGKWDLWRDTFQRISNAAQLSGDKTQLSRALHELGTHQLATGDPLEAARLLTRARDLRLQNGDPVGAAYSQHNLNHLLPPPPPPPEQPPGPPVRTPPSPFAHWKLLAGMASIALVALWAVVGMGERFRSPSLPAPILSPTTSVAMINDPGQPQAPRVVEDTPTVTPSPSPPPTTAPTGSATPTSTASHTSTYTPSPTSTFTPTPTPTATRTPTPYPDPYGYIVFASDRGDNNELYRKWADVASDAEPLTSIAGNDTRPDVSPGGDRIAFTHGGGDSRDIYYTDGTRTHRLQGPSWHIENNPAWSPDGNSIRLPIQSGRRNGDLPVQP